MITFQYHDKETYCLKVGFLFHMLEFFLKK
ncbi:hypothetical protein C7M17_01203 [Bacillus subtilis]|nr:hypothetical protein C7M17_01203 [Bacillus subtilis]